MASFKNVLHFFQMWNVPFLIFSICKSNRVVFYYVNKSSKHSNCEYNSFDGWSFQTFIYINFGQCIGAIKVWIQLKLTLNAWEKIKWKFSVECSQKQLQSHLISPILMKSFIYEQNAHLKEIHVISILAVDFSLFVRNSFAQWDKIVCPTAMSMGNNKLWQLKEFMTEQTKNSLLAYSWAIHIYLFHFPMKENVEGWTLVKNKLKWQIFSFERAQVCNFRLTL